MKNKLISFFNKVLVLTFWFILTFLLFQDFKTDIVTVIFSVSTFLLYTHVLYAGYFVISKEGIKDIFLFLLACIIYLSLIFIVKSVDDPFLWFVFLGVLFVVAIFFHLSYKNKTKQIYLKEFCNFKIYIESLGILSSLFVTGNYAFFSGHQLFLSILTLIGVIKLNITIFLKKSLYKVEYPNYELVEQPLVTIVIIAYNEEKYIEKTLESIKQQDYKKFEVYVVDDHSVDKTVEIAKKFETQIPIKVVQKEKRGISRSRNFGADFAKGELILFLDADSILPKDFISKSIEDFKKQNLSAAFFDFNAITENTVDKIIVAYYKIWLKLVQFFNPRGIGFCLLVRADLHKEILFDETIIMSEDFDYIKRFSNVGKFRIINKTAPDVSWRRFHNENRFILILKYLIFEAYRQNIGEIRKKFLSYEFGKYHKTSK